MLINNSSYKQIIVKAIQKEKKFREEMLELEMKFEKADNAKDEIEKMRLGVEAMKLNTQVQNFCLGKTVAMTMAIDKCPEFQLN